MAAKSGTVVAAGALGVAALAIVAAVTVTQSRAPEQEQLTANGQVATTTTAALPTQTDGPAGSGAEDSAPAAGSGDADAATAESKLDAASDSTVVVAVGPPTLPPGATTPDPSRSTGTSRATTPPPSEISPSSTRSPATSQPSVSQRQPDVTSTSSTTQVTGSAPATTTAPATADGTDARSFEQRVIALTNDERAKAGCPALSANDKLTAAAQGHSRDMAANRYFSHTSIDGSTVRDRIERQGYNWSRLAENIAAGHPTPEAVVDGWMNSSGHRANILNCSLTEIGVGVHESFWTQNFGTPR